MPPQAVQLAFFLLEEAIKLEPGIATAIQALFTKGDPTPEDWVNLRAKVLQKSYGDYVPTSVLSQPVPVQVLPTPTPEPALAAVDQVKPVEPAGMNFEAPQHGSMGS